MRLRTCAALAAASCVSLGAATALGHSTVASSTPADGAVLARTPATMTISFGDPIARLGAFSATRNGEGDLVKSVRVSPGDARKAVVSLKRPGAKKQAGTYRVSWRVTGPDGHAVKGVVTFRVRR